MSTTTTTAPPEHVLIRRTDLRGRVGALHAALPTESGFLTACGAPIERAKTKQIDEWRREEAIAELAKPTAVHCSRCSRVGDAIDEP
jgi:hypothetical protein